MSIDETRKQVSEGIPKEEWTTDDPLVRRDRVKRAIAKSLYRAGSSILGEPYKMDVISGHLSMFLEDCANNYGNSRDVVEQVNLDLANKRKELEELRSKSSREYGIKLGKYLQYYGVEIKEEVVFSYANRKRRPRFVKEKYKEMIKLSETERREVGKRIALDLLRDTGVRYSVAEIERMYGPRIDQMVRGNDIEALRQIEDSIRMLGNDVRYTQVMIDKKGRVIFINRTGYVTPEKRITTML